MHDLQEIQFDKVFKFVSSDISNMYTNIPTNELTNIIQHMCTHEINVTLQNELLQQCNTILSQNYIQFGTHQYIQKQGLAMGAPISSIFLKIYLQYFSVSCFRELQVRRAWMMVRT